MPGAPPPRALRLGHPHRVAVHEEPLSALEREAAAILGFQFAQLKSIFFVLQPADM